jgi:outer membrane protein insertion porin family
MKGFLSTLISILSISIILISPNPLLAQRVVERPNQEPSFKRPVVERVDLKGVYAFKAGEIKKLLYTKPNHWFNFLQKRYLSKSNVRIDEVTIKRFYMRRGYLFAQVQSDIAYPKTNKAVVTYYVDEGKQTILKNVTLEGGLDSINRKFGAAILILKLDKPINAEDVSSNGFKLRDLYANNGYPYAIDSSRYAFNEDSTQVSITYAVAESVFTVNDSTRIVSKVRTRPYVIKREIVPRPGKMYRQKDLTDSEQRLYSTGLFKFVNMHRNDSTAVIVKDTCHVGFDLGLDERKIYFWGTGIGMGNQQPYNIILLRTYARWGVRNIAGRGRGITLSVSPQFQITSRNGASGKNIASVFRRFKFTYYSSAIEADYLAPWFFKYRIPVTAKLIYEPNSLNLSSTIPYRFDRISGEGVFTRYLDRFTTTRLTAHAEFVKIRHVTPELAQLYRQNGKIQTRRMLQLNTQRDTRDNFLVPQKGSFTFGGVEYDGGILGGDFNFYKMQFSWSRYQIVTGTNVLATRIWVGWLNDMFKNGFSASEDRFIVGGATTIRGYTDHDLGPKYPLSNPADSLLADSVKGGNYMIVGNIEIRRPLFWRFGGSAFVDGGNAYAHIGEITALSIRFSAGLGLQFFTPIGPIRLDYAVRLKKQFDLSAGLFHLAILYAF